MELVNINITTDNFRTSLKPTYINVVIVFKVGLVNKSLDDRKSRDIIFGIIPS